MFTQFAELAKKRITITKYAANVMTKKYIFMKKIMLWK